MTVQEQFRRTKLLLRGPGLLLSVVFLILISYCSLHRGWWMDLTISLTLGIITSLVTLLIMCTNLTYIHGPPRDILAGSTNSLLRKIPAYVFPILVDLLLLLAWIWTVIFSVRDNKGKDASKPLDPPPTALWALAVSCAVAECIICTLCPIHTVLEYRTFKNKSGAGFGVWT